VQRIAISALPVGQELKENTLVEFTSPEGAEFAGFVRELDSTHALMDFNHPLAGKSLRFEVQIIGLL
jgi:FKBP-type peptidyl-prolyl cis-trans isomerase SlpA